LTPATDAITQWGEPVVSEPHERPSVPSAPPDAPASVIRVLLDVTTALTSSLDIDQVLGEMLTRTVCLASASAGTIILVDSKGAAQRKIAARNGLPYEVDDAALSQVLERGFARWVFERGETARVDDTHHDPRWLRIDNKRHSSRSAICLPLWRRKRILGILTLTHVRPHHFDDEKLELLEAIAGQAGIAIENAQLFGEVQRLATTDPLTGIANRRSFLERAEVVFLAGVRPVSAVMFDADHFKQVNDTHGHLVGDAVLAEVASRMTRCVGPGAIVGRFGGEEFAVLLPGLDAVGARAAAECIRAAIAAAPVPTERGTISLTVSVGHATRTAPGGTVSELLRAADDHLLDAKRAGRNQVRP
jgi:diguanylate cyclase (GGDEF)-like protein